MLQRACIAAVALAALLTSPASAATVSLSPVDYCTDVWGSCRYMNTSPGWVLIYAGEAGEPNRVTMARSGEVIVVTDLGAPLRAGAACAATSPDTARCDLGGRPLAGYRIDGGDDADSVAVFGSLAPVHAIAQPRILAGGPGDDVLIDGADASLLVGGPGSDRLVGGEGDDRFFAADRSAPGYDPSANAGVDGAEADIVDGGPGFDTADYSSRTAPLRLQTVGPVMSGGERGEQDRLSAVEGIVGGSGDDVIAGEAGADRLDGALGDDRLDGGAGDDELIGGIGDDRLSGGAGSDDLGGGEHTSCGSGRDVVGELVRDVDHTGLEFWQGPAAIDVLTRDCEEVRFGSPDGGAYLSVEPRARRRTRRLWELRNPCNASRLPRCAVQISLALPGGGATLAQAAFTRAPVVKVVLGPIAARRLARARHVAVRIRVRPKVPLLDETAFVLAVR